MYHFIINPAASSGNGDKVWGELKTYLDDHKVDYKYHILKCKGEAVDYVRNLTGANDMLHHLVVIGGDGTLNEVLNGIEDFEHTKLSCIQTGSGNDFSRNMKLNMEPVTALKHLLYEEEETVLDYGEVVTDKGDARFIISCGIGYDAAICEEVSRSKLKNILNNIKIGGFKFGKLVYALIGVKLIFGHEVSDTVVKIDDSNRKRINDMEFIITMVHPMEGGGVPFCYNADPTDGKFDICVMNHMTTPKYLLGVALVYLKKHLSLKNIHMYRGENVSVKLDKPLWIHMDGETPFRVSEAKLSSKTGLRFVR